MTLCWRRKADCGLDCDRYAPGLVPVETTVPLVGTDTTARWTLSSPPPSLPSLPLVPRSYRGDHQSTYRYGDEDEKRDRTKYLEHTKTDQSPSQNEKHRAILLGKLHDITTSAQAVLARLPESPISVSCLARSACAGVIAQGLLVHPPNT